MLNKLFYLGNLEPVVSPTAHDCSIFAGQALGVVEFAWDQAIRIDYEILLRDEVRG
jgi:hypothetical protein